MAQSLLASLRKSNLWNLETLTTPKAQAAYARARMPESVSKQNNYEMDEFYGDSVVNLVITEFVRDCFPHVRSIRWQSELVHSLMGKRMLASLAINMGLESKISMPPEVQRAGGQPQPPDTRSLGDPTASKLEMARPTRGSLARNNLLEDQDQLFKKQKQERRQMNADWRSSKERSVYGDSSVKEGKYLNPQGRLINSQSYQHAFTRFTSDKQKKNKNKKNINNTRRTLWLGHRASLGSRHSHADPPNMEAMTTPTKQRPIANQILIQNRQQASTQTHRGVSNGQQPLPL